MDLWEQTSSSSETLAEQLYLAIMDTPDMVCIIAEPVTCRQTQLIHSIGWVAIIMDIIIIMDIHGIFIHNN
jgi:hypothetical protein